MSTEVPPPGMKSTVNKTGGHCYDGCGWNMCDFYDVEKGPPAFGRQPTTLYRCALFGNALKEGSKALVVCDRIYGEHYHGPA